ncbi:MAG TPA: NADH-quinone oxidoreductase subunit A [Actinomycetaceae bacterium]|nr:NADH-quinone oxidoreductase subunit A [Actinomycetaceae bacterium]
MTNPFVPILIMAALAALLAIGGIAASAVIGPKRYNRVKLDTYECGVEATPRASSAGRFPVKYYLVAMTFIVFDVEVMFLVPWAIAFNELAMAGLIAAVSFIVIITIPFVYEWRRGALEWD